MQKIIIVGDARGNFNKIFNRINAIHAKHGPFTAAFCVGNFFGNDSSQITPYIQREKTINIPTYFIISNDEDTSIIDKLPDTNNGGEICKNLTFLGRFGVKVYNGITVGYLSGLYDSTLFSKTPSEIRTYFATKELETQQNTNINKKLQDTKAANEFRRYYCSTDIKQINYKSGVDILLTSEWPRSFHLAILHGMDKTSILPKDLPLAQFAKLGKSPIVNKLALSLSPQYHFAANENMFFRLCPYKTDEDSTHLTRFISLGQKKSVYALNMTPLNESIAAISDAKYTKCPYTLPFRQIEAERKEENETLKRVVHKRKFNEMAQENDADNHRWKGAVPPATYICHKCGKPGHYISECGIGHNVHKGVGNGTRGNRDDYFFEKFGGRRAMKRAKKAGGECWFCLGATKVESHMVLSIAEYTYLAMAKGPMLSDHLLIIPINHLSNSMKFPVGVRKEIDRYLLCLEKCYETENKVLLICDRNLQTAYTQHCYLEIVAVAKDKINGLKAVLFKEAEKENIEFIVHKKENSNKYNVASFGYLILHNNGNGEKYVHSVQSGMKQRIPLNFLRRVIAICLAMPEKAEWTACIQQITDEKNQTNRLKDKFKPYDWTQSKALIKQ